MYIFKSENGILPGVAQARIITYSLVCVWYDVFVQVEEKAHKKIQIRHDPFVQLQLQVKCLCV